MTDTTTGFYESFGSGILTATNLSANSVPIIFGALQDVTLDISGTTKQLYGQTQFPIASARGEIKISGKAKMGQISGPLYSSLFFGVASATGTVSTAYSESHAVPATPFTVTVTNGATFAQDLGVVYASSGIPLTPVAASPATGQYSVNTVTGLYTFASGDTGVSVLISYTYSQAAIGSTIDVGNPLQGVQPVFSVIVSRGYNNTGERYKLWSCIAAKLSLPTKRADWGISELDFDCFANAAGKTITLYTDV